MNPPILFEDNVFLAINKPPGIVVNRAESVKGETVQDWIEGYLPKETWDGQTNTDFKERSGIVHRIDKETSGILLIAKTPDAFRELQKQFKERVIHKTYLAIVHGTIAPKVGEIRAPVGRLPWNRERFGIVPGGKESVTRYTVCKVFMKDEQPFSFIELHPETGRTHQIRVHFKYMGYPLVSDSLYGGRKMYRDDKNLCPRLFLHACRIGFRHPVDKKVLQINSGLPTDLSHVLKKLDSGVV